jgi:hypothetical protein
MVNELDEGNRPIRSRLGHDGFTAVRRLGRPSSILERGNGIRCPRATTTPATDELGERFRLPRKRVQHGPVVIAGVEHRCSLVSG